jgi:predicted O-methyltransferase YrrM
MTDQPTTIPDASISVSESNMFDMFKTYFGFNNMPQDGGDLVKFERFSAAVDSCNYLTSKMSKTERYPSSFAVLSASMAHRKFDGLILEFGVFSGRSINHIADLAKTSVYGFDSFEGLPEDWRSDLRRAAFKRTTLPHVRENIELVIGWFNDTLPQFARDHQGPVSFLHIDCDLYSSTKTVFECLGDRIQRGTVIVFDEYFNYVGWRNHEYKAFQEFIELSGFRYDYIAVNPHHQQAAVQII